MERDEGKGNRMERDGGEGTGWRGTDLEEKNGEG